MFRFQTKATILRFDEKAYCAAVDVAIQDAYVVALRAFLKEAASRVPVRTGMARGSLIPLARFLDEELDLTGTPTVRKNPEAGAAGTTFEHDANFPYYHFSLDVETLHYKLMDNFEMVFNNYTPWLSFEHGQEAFRKAFKQELKARVPQVKNFTFVGTEVQFG